MNTILAKANHSTVDEITSSTNLHKHKQNDFWFENQWGLKKSGFKTTDSGGCSIFKSFDDNDAKEKQRSLGKCIEQIIPKKILSPEHVSSSTTQLPKVNKNLHDHTDSASSIDTIDSVMAEFLHDDDL